MNGRDINYLLAGLYKGGSALASAFIEKGKKNQAKDIYDRELGYIKDTWKNSIDAAKEILNPKPPAPPDAGDYPGTFEGVSEHPKQPEASGNEPFSMSDLYFRKEKGITDLQANKYGGPYVESLNRLYNDLYGQKKSGWEIKEGKDGEFYAINPETLETKKIITGEKKSENFKLSGDATIIPYTDDQGNAFYGWFEPDNKANDYGNKGWKHTGVNATQDQIDEFNRSGKYAKKLSGPGRSSRNSGKEEKRSYSQEEKSLASDLSKLGQLNKSFASWYNADPTTETEDQKKAREEYEALKTSLIEYFDGDYDALNLYAEKVYGGTDVTSVIDEILGSADQTEAEEETIDNIFEEEDMSGEDATLIYEKHKDSFKTKAGQKYFKNKYLGKIGAK